MKGLLFALGALNLKDSPRAEAELKHLSGQSRDQWGEQGTYLFISKEQLGSLSETTMITAPHITHNRTFGPPGACQAPV